MILIVVLLVFGNFYQPTISSSNLRHMQQKCYHTVYQEFAYSMKEVLRTFSLSVCSCILQDYE